jgi:hypothetical protein
MGSIESRFLAAAASVATLVSARGALAAYVMGGFQQNSGGAVLTEIVTEFQVPNAPVHYSSDFSLWTGLTSNTTVLQAVLRYTNQGCGDVSCPHWEMQNEVESPQGAFFGHNLWVSPGDWILGFVYLDNSNPGNCNLFTGVGCNYVVGWEDLGPNNTGVSDVGLIINNVAGQDFTFQDAPDFGWGLTVETGTGASQTYNNCTNFPQNSIGAETVMYTWSFASMYNAVPTNLSLGYPGVGGSFSFTNQGLTDGGHVVDAGNKNDCGWTCGVGILSTDVGEITMGF